jgi:hypothetical protein
VLRGESVSGRRGKIWWSQRQFETLGTKKDARELFQEKTSHPCLVIALRAFGD